MVQQPTPVEGRSIGSLRDLAALAEGVLLIDRDYINSILDQATTVEKKWIRLLSFCRIFGFGDFIQSRWIPLEGNSCVWSLFRKDDTFVKGGHQVMAPLVLLETDEFEYTSTPSVSQTRTVFYGDSPICFGYSDKC